MTRRRSFIKLLGLSGTVSLLNPTHALAFDDQSPEGYVTNEEDQETYLIGPRRAPVSFMVDKNKKGVRAISFCREEIAPGTGIPVHKHLMKKRLSICNTAKVFSLWAKKSLKLKPEV
jgi:hypothetical protein